MPSLDFVDLNNPSQGCEYWVVPLLYYSWAAAPLLVILDEDDEDGRWVESKVLGSGAAAAEALLSYSTQYTERCSVSTVSTKITLGLQTFE